MWNHLINACATDWRAHCCRMASCYDQWQCLTRGQSVVKTRNENVCQMHKVHARVLRSGAQKLLFVCKIRHTTSWALHGTDMSVSRCDQFSAMYIDKLASLACWRVAKTPIRICDLKIHVASDIRWSVMWTIFALVFGCIMPAQSDKYTVSRRSENAPPCYCERNDA